MSLVAPVFVSSSPFATGNGGRRARFEQILENTLALRDWMAASRGTCGVINGTLRTVTGYTQYQKQVQLQRSSGIILSNGQLVNQAAPLVADVTVSGAGGLDIGTEQNSRWYQPYYIRKDDGTENLCLRLMKVNNLDQSQTSFVSNYGLNDATARTWHAQSFPVGTTGQLPFVEMGLGRSGTPNGSIWLEVQTNSGGSPSGVVLATSTRLYAPAHTNNNGFQAVFTFDTPATLTSGTTYWLVLKSDYATSGANFIVVHYSDASGYAGAHKRWDGAAWQVDNAGRDLCFKTYVTVDSTPTLTLPSGYTMYTKAGPPVYNDSGGNFQSFFAQDNLVMPIGYIASSNAHLYIGQTGATTVPILLDASTVIPPEPVIVFASAGAAGAAYAQLGPVPDANQDPGGGFSGRYGGAGDTYTESASAEYPVRHMPAVWSQVQRFFGSTSNAGVNVKFFVSAWQWRG